MNMIGYAFILLGVADYIVSFAGFDFYAYFGIRLQGLAYEYSSFAAGLLGLVLITLDREKDIGFDVERSLEQGENILTRFRVSIPAKGFGAKEFGFLYVTNMRVRFISISSLKGDEISFDVGDQNYV